MKRLLGEGGMGTVYLAEHALMGWRAAVKVLRRSLADDKVLVKRFINEAHAVKSIRHPNIIDLIDVGILPDGLPYLLMELLEGESLGARLQKRGRLSVDQALHIVRQTAAALGAAHDKGIVHRDLKPDNLFLIPDPQDPDHDAVKVLDFGIAKLRDAGGGSDPVQASPHTKSGVLLGTPAYMSPEQCRGIVGEIDHRTDIYSLSVILHQMLAGQAPFVSPGTGDVLIMHISAEPPPVRLANPDVPPHVEAAILRGLAKRREQRFSTMADLAAALEPPVRGPGQVTANHSVTTRPTLPIDQVQLQVQMPGLARAETPLSWPLPPTQFSRSFYRRLGTTAAALAAALLVVGLAAWQMMRAPVAEPARPAAGAPASREEIRIRLTEPEAPRPAAPAAAEQAPAPRTELAPSNIEPAPVRPARKRPGAGARPGTARAESTPAPVPAPPQRKGAKAWLNEDPPAASKPQTEPSKPERRRPITW